jgi:hypothetical protein
VATFSHLAIRKPEGWKFRIEFGPTRGYLSPMRQRLTGWVGVALISVAATLPAAGASGKVKKVLPQFLDLKGRNSLSPSLYERDAYQAQLRAHPERRSTMRFYVLCKAKGGTAAQPLKLRVEMRGIAQGDLPKQLTLEEPAKPGGWFGHWTELTLTREQYKEIGAVTAWRVSLWQGDQMLSEQQSFLW